MNLMNAQVKVEVGCRCVVSLFVCCAFFVVVSKFYFLDSFSGRRGEQISNLLISIFILFIQLN